MPAHDATLSTELAAALRKRALELKPAPHPSDATRSYANDPVGFARDVLGVWCWRKQREILEAIRDNIRVSVSSGHKVSKTNTDAIAAIWFYCSFPKARVIVTATSGPQVTRVFWREIRMLVREALIPIPGDLHELSHNGLVDHADFSEIKGYTAQDAEGMAGVSGGNLLYICDEASGIKDSFFNAIEGNRAGGAKLLLTGNPTRSDGEFHRSHHELSAAKGAAGGYVTFTIDSRDGPNVTGEWREMREWDRNAKSTTRGTWVQRSRPVEGLALPEWCTQKAADWGEDSQQFCIRVSGKFVAADQRRVFALGLLAEAQDRWAETEGDGRLFIGLDPAGEGGHGDYWAFAARRGMKVLEIRKRIGINGEHALREIRDLAKTYPTPGWPVPVVVLDSEGADGAKAFVTLRATADRDGDFDLVRMRTSDNAVREPLVYDTVRSELAANLAAWMREGGAIPANVELEADLHALEFLPAARGRLTLIKKRGPDGIIARIGHSPDVGDSVQLSAWEPLSTRDAVPAARREQRVHDAEPAGVFDPYAGLDWTRSASR
jgi:phage terminase large subunit